MFSQFGDKIAGQIGRIRHTGVHLGLGDIANTRNDATDGVLSKDELECHLHLMLQFVTAQVSWTYLGNEAAVSSAIVFRGWVI